ncbi:matrix extracellular phosphoglycoprotein [Alligator sinensis]|uniref:Matrix extracellular phosphoglycoprotein n=1 Tax=Alligator sinensis TaxID=38654 RepID=A0A1U7RSG3_ALLSI|nr:matrix extracellular phosphoglycoprotein [Alligator sinensis]XP_006018167.1 matrix extracellular phosphoglycoprotein [Alligator sinensis]XP_006018168.1 matrix extracellular phosphoglycoprotein [Alligator sinensis]
MKRVLLCLCLFSVVCTKPVFQPYPGKANENCVGQHRILVKTCNINNGFYLFKYVYTSSARKNQTQIMKGEEYDKSQVSDHQFKKEDESKKPSEDFQVQEGGEDRKYLLENGTIRKPDSKSISDRQKLVGVNGNTSDWDARQIHSEVSVYKDDSEKGTGNTTVDIEGSGDLDFLDQIEGGVTVISGTEHDARGSSHQDAKSSGYTERYGQDREKDQSGFTGINESEGTDYNATREKDKDAIETQGSNGYRDIPKKDKAIHQDPVNNSYSGVPMTDKDGTRDKEFDNEGSGYTNFLDKDEDNFATGNGDDHLDIGDTDSIDIPERMEHIKVDKEGMDNQSYFSETGEVKVIKGNHVEGPNLTKGDRKKDEVSGRTNSHVKEPDVIKPEKNDEGYGNILTERASIHIEGPGPTKANKDDKGKGKEKTSSHMEGPDIIRPQKNDKGEENIINGRTHSHVEEPDVSRPHKIDKSEVNIFSGRTSNHIETPDIIKARKTGEGNIVSGKAGSHVDSGFTKQLKKDKSELILPSGRVGTYMQEPDKGRKMHKKDKGKVTILSGRVGSHVPKTDVINTHKKDKGEVTVSSGRASTHIQKPHVTKVHKKDDSEHNIISGRSSIQKGGPDFTKPHKKNVDMSHGNASKGKLGITYTNVPKKKGNIINVRLTAGKKDITKGRTAHTKVPGSSANAKTSAGHSRGKTKDTGHRYTETKDDTQFFTGHEHLKYTNTGNVQKTDNIQIKKHSFHTPGSDENVKKTSPKSEKSDAETDERYTGRVYLGHDRVLRRKGTWHGKKGWSAKYVHGNKDDSSQSSDSERASRSDSRQAYDFYQNDQLGNYWSAQSIQGDQDLSAEKN